MEFSLFYFDGEGSVRRPNQYRLLLDSARFADENGFTAVWTPERHFHAFGGLYPNPALTSAALAVATQRVQLRAGSLVAPLHHPVRIAEDWAVIDNLSGGRAGIAFASGWTLKEFVMSRLGHERRREELARTLDQVRRLWAGEEVTLDGPDGEVTVSTLPRPIQRELPLWITAQSPESFERAGEMGAHVLTSLLNVTLDDVAANIARYRAVLAEHGHDPHATKVTMMVHTYVGPDVETVRAQIKGPFVEYLRSHYHLLNHLAEGLGLGVSIDEFSPEDMESLLSFGFEGFLDGRALIGSPESLRPRVESYAKAGVDEIACLIDFHPRYEAVMESLGYLKQLMDDCFDLVPLREAG